MASRPSPRYRICAVLIACCIASSALAETPKQSLFAWTDLPFSAEVYRARRSQVAAHLERSGGGVLLVPSRRGISEGFTFRQTDDFLYFTGLELPDSVLAIDAGSGAVSLFAPMEDARYANPARRNDFPGRSLGSDPELETRSGIDDVRPYEALSNQVEEWVAKGRPLRVDFGRRGTIPAVTTDFISRWSEAEALVHHLRSHFPKARLDNAYEAVARVRMVHGQEEIEALRRVCDLTMRAIRHAAGFVRDGIDERGLEAELEAEYKRGGAQRLAFASIVKSGPNSLWPWRILAANYDRRNRVMNDGELVIFDVGTELDYYVSDVGRTFPVSGEFTAAQRRALELSTSVSDAIIAAIRPGVTFAELKELAVSKIPPDQRQYMQAGGFYGHHIGMSSGDPALTELPLAPGMIFTVEPWYYNHDDEISVFVEDVILVTEDGHDNLTAALPRDPASLEKMAGARD